MIPPDDSLDRQLGPIAAISRAGVFIAVWRVAAVVVVAIVVAVEIVVGPVCAFIGIGAFGFFPECRFGFVFLEAGNQAE